MSARREYMVQHSCYSCSQTSKSISVFAEDATEAFLKAEKVRKTRSCYLTPAYAGTYSVVVKSTGEQVNVVWDGYKAHTDWSRLYVPKK